MRETTEMLTTLGTPVGGGSEELGANRKRHVAGAGTGVGIGSRQAASQIGDVRTGGSCQGGGKRCHRTLVPYCQSKVVLPNIKGELQGVF
ncbi:hypothetical protein ACP4OV_019240 [Aristida adscensionis]